MEVEVIVRPNGILRVDTFLEFNFVLFTEIEIDLAHINKQGRSNYSEEFVLDLVKAFLDRNKLEAVEERRFGDDACSYFVKIGEYERKFYRVVFCICSDRPKTIGIITLFRLRRKK